MRPEVQVLDFILLTPEVGWGFHFPVGLHRISFCLGGVRVSHYCSPPVFHRHWGGDRHGLIMDGWLWKFWLTASPPDATVSQPKLAREIEIEKFIIHRFWRRYLVLLVGPHGVVKAGCRQREWQDLGYVLLLGSVLCFGVLRLRLDWSVQTKSSGFW